MKTEPTANILIVDDDPRTLLAMEALLSGPGRHTITAASGQEALRWLLRQDFSVILMDVRMPDMDGFEVCRRLKAEPAVADIPVIFMTAMDDMGHKLEGFRVGAVDYVTKPIQREELVARIRLHLQLHRLQRELVSKNAELEAYAHTIAHSLKTPLATANRFLEILHKYKSAELPPEQRQLVQQAFEAMAMTGEVVDALLLLSTVSQQSVELQPLDMHAVIENVQRQLGELQARTQASIQLPQSWPRAMGYAPWVAEVWLNLLSNAFKYGGSPPRVMLGGTADGSHVRFWVRDNGEPLSEDERARVFTPFTRLHRERAAGHGLGLATVQRIVARLGGTVGARLAPDGGNEFSFSLPAVQRSDRTAPRASAASPSRQA